MTNAQARLFGLALVALVGAVMTAGSERDIGLVIVGVSLLGFLIQFVITFRRERFEDEEFIELCQHCGYDLTGNVSGVCPECGTPVSGDSYEDDLEETDDSDEESEDDDTPPEREGKARPPRK